MANPDILALLPPVANFGETWKTMELREKWGETIGIGSAALLCPSLESIRGSIQLSRDLSDYSHSSLGIEDKAYGHMVPSPDLRSTGEVLRPSVALAW